MALLQRGQRARRCRVSASAYSGCNNAFGIHRNATWQARPGGNDNRASRRGSWSVRKQALMMTELAGGRSHCVHTAGFRCPAAQPAVTLAVIEGRAGEMPGGVPVIVQLFDHVFVGLRTLNHA